MKSKYALPILLLIIAIIAMVIASNMNTFTTGTEKARILGLSEDVSINAPMPATKEYPRYKVLNEDFDRVHESGFTGTRESLPSEEEAIKFATEYVQKHGGIPDGAYLSNVETQYVDLMETRDGEPVVVERHPEYIIVDFRRQIDGLQVAGSGDSITLFIGDDGEILYFFKTWRELEELGNVEMISAEEATEKLKRGETLKDTAGDSGSIEINQIEVGYYSEVKGYEQKFYEPVWIFKGVDSHGYNVTKVVKGFVE